MGKIARPALSNAVQFFKNEWRGIFVLAIKTYLMAIVVYILGMIPTVMIAGPDVLMKMHTAHTSMADMPPYALITQLILGIVISLAMLWLHAPLYISLSRGVLLSGDTTAKEPFDRTLFKRLLSERALRITKILALMIFMLLPFYIGLFVLAHKLSTPVSAESSELMKTTGLIFLIVTIVYLIIYIYIVVRLTYLVPAIAMDRRFESAAQAWDLTRKKGWPIIKTILLTFLLSLLIMILFIVALVVLGASLFFLVQMTGAGTVAGVFAGAGVIIMTILGVIVFYLIFPQLMGAAIASVYLLSEQGQK